VFWLLGNGVRWLVIAESNQTGAFLDLMRPMWTFELTPLIALLLAAFAWSLRGEWSGTARTGRPASFLKRQPLSKVRMAQARLIAAGISLGFVLAVLGVISTWAFLRADHALVLRIVSQTLASGETNLREVAGFLAGPLILVGLLAWVIMSPGSLRGLMIFVILAVAVPIGVLGDLRYAMITPWMREWIPTGMWFAIVLPTLWLAAVLFVAAWKGTTSKSALLVNLTLWGLVALAFFPFSAPWTSYNGPTFLLVSLALGALTVLPIISVALGFGQGGIREPIVRGNPLEHLRAAQEGIRPLRAVGLGLLLIAVVTLAWIRWPAQPAWVAAWRSQGLPATLEELNAWYPPVEESRNLALRYLRASDKANEMRHHDAVLGVGHVQVSRTEQIPSNVWSETKRYWENVGREICPDLHAAAHSGLTASRYPVDLRKGLYLNLRHLWRLRHLSRLLSLEAWVACVERRPDSAANAILDAFPIGESLKDEPIVDSQSERIVLHEIAYLTLETAMNRVTFPEEDLKRLQEGLARVLPPNEQGLIMNRGLVGATTTYLDILLHLAYTGVEEFYEIYYSSNRSFRAPPSVTTDASIPVFDVLGFEAFNRIIAIRRFAALRDWSRLAAQTNSPSNKPSINDFRTDDIQVRAGRALYFMQSLERAYDSEFKTRTQLDMARTAVAVERFRLAQGRLPKTLNELTPVFIERIPSDPWHNGKPLSYRIKKNGEFVVYSWAENKKDDHGEEEITGQGFYHGDLTFTVAPPDIRDRPQVAADPAASS
jgi:hypothetical protein